MNETICPVCGFKFQISSNRSYKGMKHDFEQQIRGNYRTPEKIIDDSSRVTCPKCSEVFSSDEVKSFGFLSPKNMKLFIGLFIASFFVFAMYVLFKSC